MKFDREQIEQHFAYLHHAATQANVEGGKLVLAAFGQNPDAPKERLAKVQHFAVGAVAEMTDAAMAFESVPHANVYAPWSIMRADLAPGKKGEEEHVAAVLALVNDKDGDPGKDVRSPLPPDYIINSSTGNFQEVLILDRALPLAEAKALGVELKRVTGGECADDMSHVWRIPGCLNWPNAKKVKDGRPRKPQPVTIAEQWKKWTNAETLRATLAEKPSKVKAEPTPKPKREKPTAGDAEPSAPPSLARYDINEVRWWIERKRASEKWALSQLDWAMLGGALKIHFGDAGLELFKLASEDADGAAKRFSEFGPYSEGDRTLSHYLDGDVVD
jgi:hypothetical protein